MPEAGPEHRRTRWLVDGSNLMGSRPDGWWNHPDRSARQLVDELDAYAAATGEEVRVVFDRRIPDVAAGPQRGPQQGPRGAVDVGYASRHGANAADDEIVRLLGSDPDPATVRVVTSDRRLAERVRELGAPVTGVMRFRDRLEEVAGRGGRRP